MVMEDRGTEAPSVARVDDRIATELRGFGPLGLTAMVVIAFADTVVKPLGAVLALVWASRSHTPWREIGYVRPKSWLGDVLIGLAFGVAFKLVLKAVVMPLLEADPINHPYHYLVGNTLALPGMLFTVTVGAGFGEETVFRGFLFERFGKLFGVRPFARTVTVLLTTALFALGHYSNLGLPGVEQAAMTGLAFGTIYALTSRLWLLMWAHAAFDVAALAIIYWNLEAPVAHLFFP